MEFRILGPVEVRGKGVPAQLGGQKQVALLSALIAQANHVVPLERLIEATWGAHPPASAQAALHTLISRLRRTLAAAEPGADARIVTQPTGYLLRLEPGESDLEEYRERVSRARAAAAAGKPAEAAREFQAGLRLWRGPALAGVSGGVARSHGASLDETRMDIVEEHTEVRLELGEHAELLSELRNLIAAHPLRERLRGQFMLALYRCGRQADALAAYQDIYRLLGDELGIRPGQALRGLHQRILTADPALDPAGEPEQERAAEPVPPRQLPGDIANFTGRTAYLEELDKLLTDQDQRGEDTAVVISAIAGTAGVGKTALALHWAHRVAGALPDGQLYVNLRGYAPTEPMRPAEALVRFLRALGVPNQRIPLDEDEQAAMYRSLLAGKRVLILLDNAAGAAQVRPLLPGTRSCLVVVTSRSDLRGLTGLQDARRLVLPVLTPDEARTLLGRIIGEQRVRAEPEAAAELARLCGHLPLALRIAAAHILGRGLPDIAAYLAELTGGDRLERLAIEDDQQAAVRASFDLSYRRLAPAAARLFRLLGLVPGQDFTPPVAAALLDAPVGEAARLLDTLAAAHLVEQETPGRFHFHDLLRRYAGEQAAAQDPRAELDAALRRLLQLYLRTADTACRRLFPEFVRILGEADGQDGQGSDARTGIAPLRFTANAQALAWLDTECANLVAAIEDAAEHGPHELSWQLVDALYGYLHSRMLRADYWVRAANTGLRAAREQGAELGAAAMLHSLAHAYFDFGDYTRALNLSRQAHQTYRPVADGRDPAAEAEILKLRGVCCWLLARFEEALDCFTAARDGYHRAGRRSAEAVALNTMCLVFVERGEFAKVLEYNERALAIHREAGARIGEAVSVHLHGYVCGELGRYPEALEADTRALELYAETGFRYNEASVLKCMAVVHRDTGDHQRALDHCLRSLEVARELSDRRAQCHALDGLASIYLCLDRPEDALRHGEDALELSRTTGFRRGELDALTVLAEVHRREGRTEEALGHASTALELARAGGFRQCTGQALTTLAETYLARREYARAAEHAGQALTAHHEVGYRLGAARTLRVLGEIRHGEGDPAAARSHWRDALAICTELGASEAHRIRSLLEAGD
ncbi:AfsR/SARP family transcriptional regulator [Amycolatopsis aidingensis]|uniref:AfsR/SARP family transcriptional regulator n=1 Tax=Amycolatopsis aidingensis TaxID=2842453 RepID=UPI001C0C9CAC|nr:BTAD domain-containing putative transcriptional regulator [Amycolatopsis aidingensis]